MSESKVWETGNFRSQGSWRSPQGQLKVTDLGATWMSPVFEINHSGRDDPWGRRRGNGNFEKPALFRKIIITITSLISAPPWCKQSTHLRPLSSGVRVQGHLLANDGKKKISTPGSGEGWNGGSRKTFSRSSLTNSRKYIWGHFTSQKLSIWLRKRWKSLNM